MSSRIRSRPARRLALLVASGLLVSIGGSGEASGSVEVEPAALETSELRVVVAEGASTTTVLTVTAASGVDACVWLEGVDLPVEAGAEVVVADGASSLASCEVVRAGSVRELPLRIEASGGEPGLYRGELAVALGTTIDDSFDVVVVPLLLQVEASVSGALRLAVALGLSIVGLNISLAALWLYDFARARFRPPARAVVSDLEVSIRQDGVLCRPGTEARPLIVGEDLFEPARLPAGRAFAWRGLELAVHNAMSPFSPPVGTAASPGAPALASSGTILRDGRNLGRVPLNLSGCWIFVLDPAATREAASDPSAADFFAVYGRLLVLRSSARAPMVDLSDLSEVAHRLARSVRAALPVTESSTQEMLEFLEQNVGSPRDLPVHHRSLQHDPGEFAGSDEAAGPEEGERPWWSGSDWGGGEGSGAAARP